MVSSSIRVHTLIIEDQDKYHLDVHCCYSRTSMEKIHRNVTDVVKAIGPEDGDNRHLALDLGIGLPASPHVQRRSSRVARLHSPLACQSQQHKHRRDAGPDELADGHYSAFQVCA